MKLSDAQLIQFANDGFLIVEDVLSYRDRQALTNEYAQLIDTIAASRGHIDTAWKTYDFEQKVTQLLAKDPGAYEYLDISLPLQDGLTTTAGVHTGPAVFDLLTHRGILDIVESIVGPEVYSNPVQHVRIKPPESALNEVGRGNSNMSRTGWHQDAAVVLDEAEDAPILTLWAAITDATTEMGCMRAIAGSHKWPSLGMHCPGKSGVGEIFIPNDLVQKHAAVDLQVKAGAIVLLNKRTWHGAGPNQSERIRWSFDLRYQPPDYPTGRACFPGFLARSKTHPEKILSSAAQWQLLWHAARSEIASGERIAVFNERWAKNRLDPLCA